MSEVHSTTSIEFRPIPGFPGYRISNTGIVQSCVPINGRGPLTSQWRTLKPRRVHYYYQVKLYRDHVRHFRKVHQLVLETFVGPRPEGLWACHNNGNPIDNRVENLRWDTPKANHADRLDHGTHFIGSRNPRAKLSDDDVRTIRERWGAGATQKSLAREYGVSQTLISYITRRAGWTHVE
jgi:hypothetical protein